MLQELCPFVDNSCHSQLDSFYTLHRFFALSWFSFLHYSEFEFKCLMAISAVFRYFLGLGHFPLALWLKMDRRHVILVHRATPGEHVKSKHGKKSST